ncbi:hypothetical protein [Streptomyces tubercidicus]|uniref:HTTM-like domain-containing protein n=1 Tax=Streptomyces tubercidicus TaxID=47759 RepID=A0A640UTX7_9ACTN|nr:hypothetical protein [Streptomyces tubercidicus]WAU12671.1 hypothetical protein STRTU_003054 [Streptomyces tubercidicus]GFE38151.1 hypothetical protein Stube_28240 [Streptomyces tubercidicus]
MFLSAPPEVTARRVASLGTLVSALEMLSRHRTFEDGELLSGQLASTRPRFAKRFPRLTRALSSKKAAVALYGVQAGASAATLIWAHRRGVRAVGSAVLAATGVAGREYTPFGRDGADQLQQVVNVVLASTGTLKDDEKARDLAMRALALETTLAYVASGVVKLVSPVWLSGEAFSGVIRTQNYGDPRVFPLVHTYPVLGKLVTWTTVAAEVGFPLVFVLPKPAATAYLGSMTLFHLGIGQLMGLNRFVPAFGATHPALLYVLRRNEKRAAPVEKAAAAPALAAA